MSVQLVSPKPSKNLTINQPFVALKKGQTSLEIIITDQETDIDGEKILANPINGSNAEYTWSTSHPNNSTASEVSLKAKGQTTVVYFRIFTFLNTANDLVWQVEPLLAADWASIMATMPALSSVDLPIDLGRVALRDEQVYCAEYYTLSDIPNRKNLNKLTKNSNQSEWVYFKLTETTLSTFHLA